MAKMMEAPSVCYPYLRVGVGVRKASDPSYVRAFNDEQLVYFQTSDHPIAKAAKVFRFRMAKIEQAEAQRKKPTILERRRMEFDAVLDIIEAYFNAG